MHRVKMKSWQVITGLLLTWLVLMMYMSSNLMGSGGEGPSSRVERQLHRALEELDLLHSQNMELQTLASELRELQGTGDQREIIQKLHSRLQKATEDLEKLSGKHLLDESGTAPSSRLTLGGEKARRKVENTATELWYYLNAKLKELEKAAGNRTVGAIVRNMQADLKGYQTVMTEDFLQLRQADGDEDWRLKESLALGRLVQRRLHFLQNPKDCSKARVVLCDLQKGCGFGCQLHHVTYCLIVAYATHRTLVLDSKGWRYASRGWDTVFMPLSDTCTDASGPAVHWAASQAQKESARVLKLPIVDSLYPRPDFMPLAIPADLAPRLNTFHGDAPVWWIGQMVRYLMRPNQQLKKEMAAAADRMKFHRPLVGVHIRRTDKVGVEAAFHSLDEYMRHVDAYFSQLEHHQPVAQRRVYLATDDPSILGDAKKRYSRYEFISDNDISRSASLGSRYTDSSLRGVIMDIHFLSLTNFLVCTFSSQVCRVAYELMQTLHGDASTYFRSLDDVFYYGGQNAHNLRAVEAHQGRGGDELTFEVGDLLGIAGNHWNGYSKGTLRKTGKSGLYPSYKVENEIASVEMPTYPEVKEEEEEEGKMKEGWERVGVAVDYGHR
ncbi:alpha-(1,6)-fucosyltransferase-like isoform X2 [Babylonia areolata]|uniref:alpha-(1,6)-fucosyltransferase-like isoform X1 n=1 Tax=Babylonia areolata TaxID=304850 RepID=UPI003FD303FC